jgi:hypothetical protein
MRQSSDTTTVLNKLDESMDKASALEADFEGVLLTLYYMMEIQRTSVLGILANPTS